LGFALLVVLLAFGQGRRGTSEGGGKKSLREVNLFTLAAVAALLFAVLTFVPQWFVDPLKIAATPTIYPEATSSPWYFLFLQETLSFFNATYPVLSVLLGIAVLFLLFTLPYIDRNPERSLLHRPLSLSGVSALAAVLIYFTLLGLASADYGEKVVIPREHLSAMEIRGARVFSQKNCAYCHQIFGRVGRREGPDMAVVVTRKRTPEWIQRFILNPRLYRAGTTMPRYEIPLEDLEGLSAYLLSLEPGKRNFQTIDRGRLVGYGTYLASPGEK